jgi:hypothetical protein
MEQDMTHPTLVPIYEYYAKDAALDRFQYSASPDLQDGWLRSGIAFFAFTASHPGVLPIYQYHAEDPWRYQYSRKPDIQDGWIRDGIAFYAYTFEHSDSLPIHQYHAENPWRYQYRLQILGANDAGGGRDWRYEGVAFFGFAASSLRLQRG